jgi:hypothetical protein
VVEEGVNLGGVFHKIPVAPSAPCFQEEEVFRFLIPPLLYFPPALVHAGHGRRKGWRRPSARTAEAEERDKGGGKAEGRMQNAEKTETNAKKAETPSNVIQMPA